jgi:hypothetical protein
LAGKILNPHSNRISNSVIVGFVIFFLAILLVCSIAALSPLSLIDDSHRHHLIIILLSSFIGAVVAFGGEKSLSGLTNGISIVVLSTISNQYTSKPHYLAAFIFGIILGSLFPTYPYKVTIAAVIIGIAFILFQHFDCVLVLGISFIAAWIVTIVSEKLFNTLRDPISQYITSSNQTYYSFLAFFIGYLLIIIFFALIYILILVSNPLMGKCLSAFSFIFLL